MLLYVDAVLVLEADNAVTRQILLAAIESVNDEDSQITVNHQLVEIPAKPVYQSGKEALIYSKYK